MKYRYSKFVADLADEVDLEKLLVRLSDLLLSSGFNNPWDPQSDDDRAMQALHDAILDALLNGGALSDEMVDQLLSHDGTPEEHRSASASRSNELVQKLIERLGEQGYISLSGKPDAQQLDGRAAGRRPGRDARSRSPTRRSTFSAIARCATCSGSMGRSAAGRHDTRELDTGIEAGGPPREYEFGDTMNLDASATVLNAVSGAVSDTSGRPPYLRSAPAGSTGIEIDYQDLMVTQGDYQSSCATVLLLDCSHSMVLYGEDRFTPAKRVAMALANLIRHQYPGDALNVVLFHDSAEEVPLARLGRVRVGPYYTNTREGLRLARRCSSAAQGHAADHHDHRRQAVSGDAAGRPHLRNAFGLDPFVLRETFAEVAACRRAGIMINTFMLARDYDLVAFVRRVARICRGKAYFTTPYTLGPVRAAGLPHQQDADSALN